MSLYNKVKASYQINKGLGTAVLNCYLKAKLFKNIDSIMYDPEVVLLIIKNETAGLRRNTQLHPAKMSTSDDDKLLSSIITSNNM
jgi:hypothetical protein